MYPAAERRLDLTETRLPEDDEIQDDLVPPLDRQPDLVWQPDEVAETLARKGIENEESREGSYRFLTTGDPAAFRSLGERFLQLPLGEVEHVAVADLVAA